MTYPMPPNPGMGQYACERQLAQKQVLSRFQNGTGCTAIQTYCQGSQELECEAQACLPRCSEW